MRKLSHIKRIRLHHEGINTLVYGFITLALLCGCLYCFRAAISSIPFYIVLGISIVVYAIVVNFFRCPIRRFEGETENLVVAPADGKVVVVEEVEENEYFHDRRKMVSVFMSLTKVEHQNGNFHKAWLPKASMENERSTVVIETPDGREVLVRQIAGAVARRIVTYAKVDEECYIDEHMGFIKFGSRVDVYLPLDTEICVAVGQRTTGNQTIIGHLKA